MDRASEDDFAAYVGLRWEPLVRTLVLLGCPTDRAEQVTRTALSRVHRSWARVRRADDVDVQVFRRLLHTWPETRRRHTRRTALVLHTVGGLTEAQVGAVLGSGAVAVGDHLEEDDPLGLLGRGPDDDRGRAAAARRDRGRQQPLRRRPGPRPRSRRHGRGPGRRRDGSSCSTTRAAPTAAPPKPTRATTATLPYLADGRLHVGALTLPVRGATDLTDPGVGAVYRTEEADVVLVDEEGGTAEIGHNAAPGLVADPVRGWVFWRTYTSQLVVFDAREGHSVAIRTSLDPLDFFRFARPLALDRGYRLLRLHRGRRRLGPRRRSRHPHRPGPPGVPHPCGRPRRCNDPPRHEHRGDAVWQAAVAT